MIAQPAETVDAATVRAALEHAALGLLTFPAATELAAPMALLAVDLAVGELDEVRVPVAHLAAADRGGPVTYLDIVAVLHWAEAALRDRGGHPDENLAYARATVHIHDTLAALDR